ncbi:MAG: CusA/CzcA family heavy metal efflux RND transporter [Reichenbachiella sp.]|uniref:CusA/CzcA family heavy metal efflux RND transporter n=1 Tax=Reichenbachiella sp. TaxID=2184521 RepID=UPI00326753A1
MIKSIIVFSVKNKLLILLFIAALVGWGVYSITQIPIGAVPDVTNNQVQIITTSRNLSTQDIEQFITYPVELEMANLPGVKEIRSISKFGLSVVTVVFDDDMGTYLPRQLIAEKIKSAQEKIPSEFGSPEMGPITTGLGEIYQYILDTEPGYETQYSTMDLRTIQDWVVKRQLSGIPGVVEVNTWGGYLKQYEVSINPERLKAMNVSIREVFSALSDNNGITGAGYIEKLGESYFIRGDGMVQSLEDIRRVAVKTTNGIPILINDIADVKFGTATRFGAITGNGEGEKVLGQVMMLKDANANKVIEKVKERVAEVQKTLPEGVFINPFLERTELINKTTFTVSENLILGALIVIFVLVLLLGNLRAGLLVSSIIPLSLLFGISMMNLFGVSANLMSLGAIDFGIIIDGAVIIIEFIVFKITQKQHELLGLEGKSLKNAKDKITIDGASKMMHAAIFGQIIILIVFIPILSLTGIEGKMFRPMALSFSFALIGAMILSLTYVPVMTSLICRPGNKEKKSVSDRIMGFILQLYKPSILLALQWKKSVLLAAVVLFLAAVGIFTRLGGEFIPTLDEGDYVVQPVLKTGTSLSKTVEIMTQLENILIDNFPEVDQVVTRIGAAEVPTDPMSMEETDMIIKLIPKGEWTSAVTKDQLADKMKAAMSVIPGLDFEFTQPIEMRFNELVTGVRADVAIKIYGEDLDVLYEKALQAKALIRHVAGAADISVEKTAGLPQMAITYDREKLAHYGLNVSQLNTTLQMAFGGAVAGVVFEGERRFDLVVRFDEVFRKDIGNVRNLFVDLPNGEQIPLQEIADISYKTEPAKISRDDTKRRIVVGINVRNRDMESLVREVQEILNGNLNLASGYYLKYSGQFENLLSAKKRLMVAVPVALVLILLMLYFTFNSFKQALMVYSAIPLSAIGGVFFLWIRDLPFSISAGVGFIALFGIAVLNGIVLIDFFNELKAEGIKDVEERVLKGTTQRLRPVLLTAAAAALGFFPMAFSASAGAEVQRPLATVVIGGLVTATILTLIILPILYTLIEKEVKLKTNKQSLVILIFVLGSLLTPLISQAQNKLITHDEALSLALENNAQLKAQFLKIEQRKKLQKTALDLGKTSLYYGFDQNNVANNNNPLDVYGVQQSFSFPTVYGAESKVQKLHTSLSENNYEMMQLHLKKNVSQTYYQLLYLLNRAKQLDYLDSLYKNFVQAASKKYEVGESQYLEKVTAEAKYYEIGMQKSQLSYDIKSGYESLNEFLQLDEPFQIQAKSLDKIPIDSTITLANLTTNPSSKSFNILSKLALANVRLQRNKLMPDLNLEYFRGYGIGENAEQFYGYQFGISLPLFFGAERARLQANILETQIIEKQAENNQKELNTKYTQLMAQIDKYNQAIIYYKSRGLTMAKEIESTARKSYESGETGYLQFIQSLENATQINAAFLDNVNRYNQLVLEVKYLQNVK